MLGSGARKCVFSRMERAEGNADLPAAAQGCWPPRTRQGMWIRSSLPLLNSGKTMLLDRTGTPVFLLVV